MTAVWIFLLVMLAVTPCSVFAYYLGKANGRDERKRTTKGAAQ